MIDLMKISVPIAVLLLLTGCWDRVELNDLSLVTAIAFDKPDNDSVQATVQIIIPKSKGGGSAGGGGGGGEGAVKQTITRTASGSDIADALSKLQMIIPRTIFWGQCKVFLFGEELAKEGVQEHVDFLLRHPQPRERGFVFVSKGKAADTLELFPPIERSSSEVMREMAKMKIGMSVTLEELSIMLKGESRALALPLVYILPKAKSSKPFETIAYLSGAAVLKNGRMTGEITAKETRGVLWVRNQIQEFTVTVEDSSVKGKVSLHPLHSKVKLIPRIANGKWTMNIKVKTKGDLIQNSTLLNPMNPKLMKKMEQGLKEDIQTRIRESIAKVQQEQADIIGFADAYRRKYPKQWAKSKDDWDALFAKIEVTVDVEGHINRPGLINAPGGVPKERVVEK